MLPITNSFLPEEAYYLFYALTIGIAIFYFIRINSDLKTAATTKHKVVSGPFYAAFILSVLSLIALFLPAIEFPLIGGISIFEMTSQMDDDMIYLSLLIMAHILMFTFTGLVAFKQINFKGAKSENLDLAFAFITIIVDAMVLVELIGRINPTFENENMFTELISETIRIGSGMYILLVLSGIQLILALLSNKFSAKSSVISDSSKDINIDELRELKKLVDEGVITQEDFENRKKKIL